MTPTGERRGANAKGGAGSRSMSSAPPSLDKRRARTIGRGPSPAGRGVGSNNNPINMLPSPPAMDSFQRGSWPTGEGGRTAERLRGGGGAAERRRSVAERRATYHRELGVAAAPAAPLSNTKMGRNYERRPNPPAAGWAGAPRRTRSATVAGNVRSHKLSETAAEALVRRASAEVGFEGDDLDLLCTSLRDQFVRETWQLEYIDSLQWSNMRAPIGVVAAIKRRLDLAQDKRKQKAQNSHETLGTTATLPTTSDTEFSTEDYLLPLNQAFRHKPPPRAVNDTMDLLEFLDDSSLESETPLRQDECAQSTYLHDAVNETKRRKSVEACRNSREEDGDVITMPGMCEMIRAMFSISTFFDWIIPFDHQKTWKRGALHAMPSQHLQRYMLNTAEQWFVLMALYCGCCLGLWEVFPDVGDDPKLGIFGVVFNCAMVLDIFACMGAVIMYGVVYAVSGAIHPSRYKKFCLLVINGAQVAEYLLVTSVYLFICVLIICMHVRISIIQSDTGLNFNSSLVTLITFLVACVVLFSVLYNINLMSRVAFNGSFMMAEDRRESRSSVPLTKVKPNTAYEFECEEMRNAFNGLNASTEKVLNRYMLKRGRERRRQSIESARQPSLGDLGAMLVV